MFYVLRALDTNNVIAKRKNQCQSTLIGYKDYKKRASKAASITSLSCLPEIRLYLGGLQAWQLCVVKRDAILAVLYIGKARYYAEPWRYRARIQRQLRTRGRTLADWDEGLALINWCNELAHPTEADTRADVACVTAHAVRFLSGVIYGPARKARLKEFVTMLGV